ncbi:MAG: hypothetical protein HQL40_20945 [Alphaproteobacteria bacterium]|nr:hypothetical protein [Alphaproteobacteria bacterium]
MDEYLKEISVKTVLVEEDYVDKHYLEDYAGYYSRCFSDYRRKCSRLHFFRNIITQESFQRLLSEKSASEEDLQKHYAGFIVVKPLPKTVIGRTCLANYFDNKFERCFPVNQKYDVSLFGFPLSVHSLAFQEQDTDVAACATSALWSAFQATGRIFQHEIPSPVAITRAASIGLDTRTMPNDEGLTSEQMAAAIRSVGLEPHVISVLRKSPKSCDADLFRSASYAYLRAGIPCLACGALVQVSTGKVEGLHAITLNGFHLASGASLTLSLGPALRATRIDRLYAHDDGVGPFARLKFTTSTEPIMTSWRDRRGNKDHMAFVPHNLLIPTYHKIRVPFAKAVMGINEFDKLLEAAREKFSLSPSRWDWDIYLCDAGRLKNDLLKLPTTVFDMSVLTGDFPKYTWVYDLYEGTSLKAKLFMDATDLLQGSRFIRAVCYDSTFGVRMSSYQKGMLAGKSAAQQDPITRAIFDWFANAYP